MSSGGGGSSKTTTVQELSPQQKEILRYTMPTFREFAKNTPELYPGSAIAGFDPLQLYAQDTALNTAQNFIEPFVSSTIGAHQDLQQGTLPVGQMGLERLISGLGTASPAQNFLLSGASLYPGSNPALERVTQAAIQPLEQSLLENILPAIRGEAITAGGLGGSRQGIAEGRALDAFTREAGNVTADIQNNAYSQGLQAMVQALGQTLGAGSEGTQTALGEGVRSLFAAPQLSDFALLPASIYEDVGGVRRAMEQALLSEDADRFLTEQMLPLQIAQEIAGAAFGFGGGSTTSRSSGGGGGIDPFTAITGGASTLAALLPLFGVSDRRLKTNIQKFGRMLSGIPVYTYEYIFEPGLRRIGVMADEVPEYARVRVNGYDHVLYGLLK